MYLLILCMNLSLEALLTRAGEIKFISLLNVFESIFKSLDKINK